MSIRTYAGTIYLCVDCGQPAYEDDDDYSTHFDEQWDGVGCQNHPLAGRLITVDWAPELLAEIQRCYPNTNPDRPGPTPEAKPFVTWDSDRRKWAERYGVGFVYAAAGPDVTLWCMAIAENAGAELYSLTGW